jgi:hypothetical protein
MVVLKVAETLLVPVMVADAVADTNPRTERAKIVGLNSIIVSPFSVWLFVIEVKSSDGSKRTCRCTACRFLPVWRLKVLLLP